MRGDEVDERVAAELLSRGASELPRDRGLGDDRERFHGLNVTPLDECLASGIDAVYFVVEPSRHQLVQIARLVDDGLIRSEIDSVFRLSDARAAFERTFARGKRGKVVLRVVEQAGADA